MQSTVLPGIMLCFALPLMACVETTPAPAATSAASVSSTASAPVQVSGSSGTPVATINAVYDVFGEVGVATFVAENCDDIGLRPEYTRVSRAIDKGLAPLPGQGHAARDIAAARRTAGQAGFLHSRYAIEYLNRRGARQGNPGSVCAVGRQEVAAGTFVGSLLRRM